MTLLASKRHRPEDIEHWSRCERMDAERAVTLLRGRKVGDAERTIRAFADGGPCYVGTSWGKDSVVVAHMVSRVAPELPVAHVVQEGPHKDPEQDAVRDAFLARWRIDYHEIVVPPMPDEQGDMERSPQLEAGIAECRRRWGKRWVSGLRADESGARAKMARIDTARERAGRYSSTCCPIRWWSADDVFAYLYAHGLPVHPSYACTRGGMWDRGQIRVSIIGGKKGRGFGREEWERVYYGDVVRRIALAKEAER